LIFFSVVGTFSRKVFQILEKRTGWRSVLAGEAYRLEKRRGWRKGLENEVGWETELS
jgi:hypothetical protein